MDLEDEKMEKFILDEERHREIVKAVKSLEFAINNIPKQEKIDLSPLEGLKSSIESFINAQKDNIAPSENVDMGIFVEAITQMSQKMTDSMDELKAVVALNNQPRNFEHTVERNYDGERITKVHTKQVYNKGKLLN